ncbi:hypothetical protein GQ457_18G012820 [Hibiscus cannabinus]
MLPLPQPQKSIKSFSFQCTYGPRRRCFWQLRLFLLHKEAQALRDLKVEATSDECTVAWETYSLDVCNRCVGDCPPKVNTVAPRTLYTQSSKWTMARMRFTTKNNKLSTYKLKAHGILYPFSMIYIERFRAVVKAVWAVVSGGVAVVSGGLGGGVRREAAARVGWD